MPLQEPPKSDLIAYLKRENPALYGKVAELRGEVTRWLTYVPQTFGHFTSHTIDHSDEIVLQVSKLLFEPKKRNPVVELGGVGAYLLIAGAYLHDAGMVASDAEKVSLLGSEDWRDWITSGSGAVRWRQVEELRDGAGSDPLKHFAVDRTTRLLVAEFIRRQHHRRAGDLVRSRAMELGRIDVGEPMLRDAIAEICIAHGLDLRDLEDDIRFPEARDILGERVNVRLIATLLRLGDLLDMRFDRACPLLLQAACPLPADSYAHWTQYESIKHRLTTSARIELRAECRTHEEHRALHDWCSWLVKEVASLPARLSQTTWSFPQASMGESATIQIKPAPEATYIPEKWTFELDQDAVFQRLIADVYNQPNVFLRELIQNALDATRCRMYEDLQAASEPIPEFPTQAAETVRERYPVRVSLREEKIENELSGEEETVQIVSVEDHGVGMDLDIIQRYLLQVGRSYYTTAEFRRAYPFHPTSRFGVGFLSVFAVSDHVTIETYKPTSKKKDDSLRLVLTGPRSYVLTEKTRSLRVGTRVEVRLRKALNMSLQDMVRSWCVFVEFPVEVDELGCTTVVRSLRREFLPISWLHPLDPSVAFKREFHPINRRGLEGGFTVVTRTESGKERWVSDAELTRIGSPIDLIIGSGIAINGISIGGPYRESKHINTHIDVRREAHVPVARSAHMDLRSIPDVLSRLVEILAEHFGHEKTTFNPEEWLYRWFLTSDVLRNHPAFHSRSDMMPYYETGQLKLCSLDNLLTRESLFIPASCANQDTIIPYFHEEKSYCASLPEGAILLPTMVTILSATWQPIFQANDVTGVCISAEGIPIAELQKASTIKHASDYHELILLVSMTDIPFDIISFGDHSASTWVVINKSSEFGQWWQDVENALIKNDRGLHNWPAFSYELRHATMLASDESSLRNLIALWNSAPALPAHLTCPTPEPRIYRRPPIKKPK